MASNSCGTLVSNRLSEWLTTMVEVVCWPIAWDLVSLIKWKHFGFVFLVLIFGDVTMWSKVVKSPEQLATEFSNNLLWNFKSNLLRNFRKTCCGIVEATCSGYFITFDYIVTSSNIITRNTKKILNECNKKINVQIDQFQLWLRWLPKCQSDIPVHDLTQ